MTSTTLYVLLFLLPLWHGANARDLCPPGTVSSTGAEPCRDCPAGSL
ncbi:unnamed protein product [Chondrus crispus]|uniref:Tyrosine-protein kinase ephrin type A/B receptor-like domain-containing protein n=1 Tax=Chondrus crispus TaxID=2769 RepID=R7QKA5_CHOCR|nr:unnamed protein product [Chondrus crispus]CDF38957.1 unnamed protein product [Chondrus crispus]|eukprot:XP_005718862.1 unnamed protein product [Chondrus crispus]